MSGSPSMCFLCGNPLSRRKPKSASRKRERHRKPEEEVILNMWEERCALSVCQILRIPPGHPASQVLISTQHKNLNCSACDQLIRNVDFSLNTLSKLQQGITKLRQVIFTNLQTKWTDLVEKDSALSKKAKQTPSQYSHVKDKDFFILLDKVQEEQCTWTELDFLPAVVGEDGITLNTSDSNIEHRDLELMQIKEELILPDDDNHHPLDEQGFFDPESFLQHQELPEGVMISTDSFSSKKEITETPENFQIDSTEDSDAESTVMEDPDWTQEEEGSDEEYEHDEQQLKSNSEQELEGSETQNDVSGDEEITDDDSKINKSKATGKRNATQKKVTGRKLGVRRKGHFQKLAEKNNKIRCPHGCPQKFRSELGLENHIRIKHEGLSEKEHKCEECGKVFNRIYGFKAHAKVHQGERHRQTHKTCSFCGIWLPNEEIEAHESLHRQREQPFSCLICDNSETKYLGLAPLNKHMKEDHTEQCGEICDLHRCKECPKIFLLKRKLYDHLREVHGDLTKRHLCDVCGKVFGARFLVDIHKRKVHVDKSTRTPWICELCGQKCSSLEYLNWHRQIHTAGLNFKCKLCDKAFKFKKSLKKHEQIHAGLQFPCPDCQKVFSTLRYLQQHGRVHLPREQRKYYYKTKDDGRVSKKKVSELSDSEAEEF